MYVVVRKDMTPGQMACQAAHALADYAMYHRARFEVWQAVSNHICILEVADSSELLELACKLRMENFELTVFAEPDLGNQATAFCVGPEAKSFLRKLRLAFKDPAC